MVYKYPTIFFLYNNENGVINNIILNLIIETNKTENDTILALSLE